MHLSVFHYVRTVGDDGGVDACDGPAIGLDLESLLEDGLPPWNISLEIIAALCEILDICHEDKEIHGDITPEFVFIDETGAISIEGFGREDTSTMAPEGRTIGPITDSYGLGYVAMRLFGDVELGELPDDDPDGHDDVVIDAVLTIDLSGLAEEMQGDIQWYVAKLMSFDREDRPTPLEAWRTFIAFADSAEGPTFEDWCNLALDGGGERREAADPAAPAADEDGGALADDLGGPTMAKGPLATGSISFDGGGSAGKGATAFWSKDQMKAALDKEEDEDDGFRPAVGGGSATAFWSKSQMDAMRDGKAEAPRPKRAEGEGKKRQATMMMRRVPKKEREKAEKRQTAAPPAPPAPASRPSTPPASPPPAAPVAKRSAPAQPAMNIQGPQGPPSTPAIQPPPPPPAPQQAGGSKAGLIVGGVVALIVIGGLLCFGVGGMGGLAYMFSGDETSADASTTDEPPAPAPKPTPQQDTDEPEPEPEPEPKRTKRAPQPAAPSRAAPRPSAPAPRTPAPAPRTPAPAPRTPAPAPAAPAPPPAPASGPAQVRYRSTGRGRLICGSKNEEFDGMVTLRFEPFELPVSCLVMMEGKRGVFQVYGSGSVTCNLSGGDVVCDRAIVQ